MKAHKSQNLSRKV